MTEDYGDDDRQRAEICRSPPGRPVWYKEEPDRVSLLQIANLLLRHRWKVLGMPVLVAFLAVGVAALQPDTFTADASIRVF